MANKVLLLISDALVALFRLCPRARLTFGSVGNTTLTTLPKCLKMSSRCPSCTLRVRWRITKSVTPSDSTVTAAAPAAPAAPAEEAEAEAAAAGAAAAAAAVAEASSDIATEEAAASAEGEDEAAVLVAEAAARSSGEAASCSPVARLLACAPSRCLHCPVSPLPRGT